MPYTAVVSNDMEAILCGLHGSQPRWRSKRWELKAFDCARKGRERKGGEARVSAHDTLVLVHFPSATSKMVWRR